MNNYTGFFSGQGSQYVGMAKDIVERTQKGKEIFECGSDILGYNLAEICAKGPEEVLNYTVNAQPAIFAHSLSAYYSALEFIGQPVAVAGHSLGEFAALQVAGAYSMEDGFKIIKARSSAMEKAAEKSKGAMAAILRADYSDVSAACKQAGGLVEPVNINTDSQTVISGEENGVDRAIEIITAANKRARAMKLAVTSAFHTSMMQPAAEELAGEIENIKFNSTTIPFYSNVTGDSLEITNYPQYFARHMVSPVLFTQQCRNIAKLGATNAVEFGPKKVVAGLVGKNILGILVSNVDTLDDLKQLIE